MVAAVPFRDTEVRLFSSHLARLPPVRTRGKGLEALAVAPEGGHLAVGAADGQVSLYSVDDPEQMPQKLHRAAPPRAGGAADAPAFVGLHFFLSAHQLAVCCAGAELGAALLDAEARGGVVAALRPADVGMGGLVACAPLGADGAPALLLVDGSGRARVWDTRLARPALALDLGDGGAARFSAAAADPARWAVAAAAGGALHWSDLRARRQLRLPTCEGAAAGCAGSVPCLAFGPRGALLASWAVTEESSQQARPFACVFSGGGAPSQVAQGGALSMPLASCRMPGGGPLLLSLARPARRGWEFSLCAVGVPSAAVLPAAAAPPKDPRGRRRAETRQRAGAPVLWPGAAEGDGAAPEAKVSDVWGKPAQVRPDRPVAIFDPSRG
ncbi:unnamed protein product [Prorocentrum cordatum]|uniref:Anaphase-promoting complex subunit 4 WD40 domain-containing protein n=1 Tax=Prorocentrum cordatum TaxID=2364126 RepID=A0ABN9TGH9_9DINO|nr:unnamed protein product [Polarella glacialis]